MFTDGFLSGYQIQKENFEVSLVLTEMHMILLESFIAIVVTFIIHNASLANFSGGLTKFSDIFRTDKFMLFLSY